MNSLGSLPTEVVGLVLDNITGKKDLYQCTLINKIFYTEAIQRLWREPIELKKGDDMTYSSLGPYLRQSILIARSNPRHALTPLGHYIRKLSFWRYKDVLCIFEMLNYCPLVEELTLIYVQITDEDMERIFSLCPCLKLVTLHLLHDITDSSITALVRHCPKLEGIRLGLNLQLTVRSLVTLKGCPLKRLTIADKIHGCSEWRSGVRSRLITLHTIHQLLPTDGSTPFPLLTELNLSPSLLPSKVKMHALTLFTKSLSGIYKLGTTLCRLDDGFFAALTTMPNLQQLDLSIVRSNYRFTNVYPRIQGISIDLIYSSRNVLLSIANTMPNLKFLAIKSKHQPCPLVMRQAIIKCTGLICVDLSGCDGVLPSIPGVVWGMNRTLGKGQLDLVRQGNCNLMDVF